MSAPHVTVRACAKINLTLRVLGTRPDGFHEVRTTLQSIALHDVLRISRRRGTFEIACDEPGCPTGRRNIVWQAAARLWRADGRRGQPAGACVRIEKRIPMAAGLGGGSSDAAAALRGLAALWRIDLGPARLAALAATLGSDVPYFVEGGTALGVERGEVVYPLIDAPPRWVALVVPPFGVPTPDAYRWFDAYAAGPLKGRRESGAARRVEGRDAGNDLQGPVVQHHADIGRIARALEGAGAASAAMSGSGSAVFGLFGTRDGAETAAAALAGAGRRIIVTQTLTRRAYARLTAPALARK